MARELAGVRRHRVEETPLAFGKDHIKGEGGLAGSGETGDHDELIVRDRDVDVFEIMVAEAVDGDLGLGSRDVGFGRLF